MTEYAYYGLNIGPGEDGPIWRFMDDFETGVYLRRHTTEPAVVGRSEVSQYKGYRRFHDVEVPLWARPPGEASVRITPDISEFEDTLTALLPEEPTTPRGGVLEEAHDLIHGERNANYGTPTENFERTAALWNAQLGHKLADGAAFTPQDVAMLMVQLKMARLVTSPGKRDHYVDAAGYLACGWECQGA